MADLVPKVWDWLFKYKADLYGVADKEVLAVGLILVGVCAVVRTMYEGKGWIKIRA